MLQAYYELILILFGALAIGIYYLVILFLPIKTSNY